MDDNTNTVDCARASELGDHYVSGELGEADRDAVERHVADCAACAADLERTADVRSRLRGALASDADAPEILVARVRSAVRTEALRSGRTRLMRFAAAAAVAIAASAIAWSAHDASPAPLVATAPAAASEFSAPILRVGLDHHLHCTRSAPAPERPLSPAAIDTKLGAGYEGLAEAVVAKLGNGLTLVDGHHCSSEGNHYAHLVLRSGDGQVVSVLAARRAPGGAAIPADARLDERGARAAAYEGDGFVVYVVSNDDRVDPSPLAAALGPLVGPLAPPARA